MARLIDSPTGSGPVGPFEAIVLNFLLTTLPDTYLIIPNFSIKQDSRNALELDLVVFAPHAVYVVEAKEWYCRLTGDDTEWLLNGKPRPCPLWPVDHKCKVLKGQLGPVAKAVTFEPLLIIPDEAVLQLSGNWAFNAKLLKNAPAFLKDAQRLGNRAGTIGGQHAAMIQALQGAWAKRLRNARRRIGGYEIAEVLQETEGFTEVLARRAAVPDPAIYRVRSWSVSPWLSRADRETRLNVVRRPTIALAKIGPHPHLLRVLHFDELPEDHAFYEVTEWSEYGTLHGYLKNAERDRLTLRERIAIAAGVADGLVAVHAAGLVHRNLCPETILIGHDREPRLTDFDRAAIDTAGMKTVFPTTQARNRAYLAPELADTARYETSAAADLYSLGVLLYELIVGEPPFTSPEAAVSAGGKLPPPPTVVSGGVDPRLFELAGRLLRLDRTARSTAEDARRRLRELLDEETGAGASKAPAPAEAKKLDDPFAPGTILDGRYRIERLLGEGAFSKVFKVTHLEQEKVYAMKVLFTEDQHVIAPHEFNTGAALPTHANLVRTYWLDRLSKPIDRLYLLSELVDGESLQPYCDGKKTLPLAEVRAMGLKVLEALTAMHTAGFLHRDIKPANIILELPVGRPKLIDFNIATKVAEASGRGGTPRYWARDRGDPTWRADADLFSFGVVLYELVTHVHPYPDDNPEKGDPVDPRHARSDLGLSAEFAALLLKSVAPLAPDRFSNASDMHAALLGIANLHAPVAPPKPDSAGEFPGLTLLPEERGRPDYNPYVTRLLTLYSQASRTNSGTRGLDEIARLTYIPTQLDNELAPAIVDGRYRLVIITGNAGDGKTAFLQQIEEQFKARGAAVERLPSKNGARWALEGREYLSNYDGSQDEADVQNDEVLDRFFTPFAGDPTGGLDGQAVRLIAINEGRLRDFLNHASSRDKFTGLRRSIDAAFASGATPPEGFLLVNLNLRAVAAGGRESILERQLQALLDPRLWRPCMSCRHVARCPLKHNADTLSDPASGPAVRDRIRRLFETLHLRRTQHITVRDLRSALSWLLLRDRGCDDVARLLARTDPKATEELANLYYPEAFAASLGSTSTASTAAVEDRLVRRLRETDVGLVDAPPLDRRLHHDRQQAVPWMVFENRSSYADEVLDGLQQATPMAGDGAPLADTLKRRRVLLARLRRWAYFERRDDGWKGMLPYRSLEILESVALAADPERGGDARNALRDMVVEAISLSEGMRHKEVRQKNIALRATRTDKPAVLSFRLFPKERFSIEVSGRTELRRFVEMAPDVVRLVAAPELGNAELRLTLDLLEMLDLIRSGFRPSAADMRGLFVNLVIFRNALLHLPYDRVVITSDNRSFFEVAASTGVGRIALEIGPCVSLGTPADRRETVTETRR